MNSAAPTISLGIDPLIAEAKQRARRRRMLALAAAAIAVTAFAATLTSTLRSSGPTVTSAGPAQLHNAVALGTLVAFDRRTATAVFRIACGWHFKRYRATTQLRPGLYRISLRGGLFNVSDLYDAADEIKLPSWERGYSRSRWGPASIRVGSGRSGPYLSTGPTTDICHGVLG